MFIQNLRRLTTSKSLRTPEAVQWLQKIKPVEELLDKLFSAISPKLHSTASTVMGRVRSGGLPIGSKGWPQDDIVRIAGAASGVSVIANRASVCHVDTKGSKEWYDFLLTAGTYNKCWFRLPDLQLQLEYLPGTVVALNGRILRHEVLEWKGGDRVCYAHWTRPNVLEALSTGPERDSESWPSWVAQSDYMDLN